MPTNAGLLLTVTPTSEQISLRTTSSSVTVGSRASFTSDARRLTGNGVLNHKIFALIPDELSPLLWKDCGSEILCAASTIFYRATALYSQVIVDGQTFVSKPISIDVVGGEAPKPSLYIKSKPAKNQVEIGILVPSGEEVRATALVDGARVTDKALALCDTSCSVVIQINVPGSLTAFTWVGGKYEASNTITVMPE